MKDTDAGAQPPSRSPPPPTSWRGPGATGRGGVTTNHNNNNPYSPHGSNSSFSNSGSSHGGSSKGSNGENGAGGTEAKSMVRTKHVLFIFSGAFNALRANVALEEEGDNTGHGGSGSSSGGGGSGSGDALGKGNGAATTTTSSSASSSSGRFETRHFVDAGMEPEFMGRVPVSVWVWGKACRRIQLLLY